jgi:autotransporter-associated beta strand protein
MKTHQQTALGSLPSLALTLLALMASSYSALAADKYWRIDGTSSTWTASNWGTVAAGPFTTGWTANDNAIFNANSSITNVTNTAIGNVTVADGVTVTLTAAGTYATGGAVRTLTVGTGSILDYAAQGFSTVAGTGFIKDGAGIFFTSNGTSYTGGFTLNAGTVIVGGVNALGNGGALAINGGTIAANGTRNITARYSSVTIGGDFTIGGVTTGVATGNGSATANITFADNMSLGAATRKITIGSNATYTLGGILSGGAGTGLTVDASGGATGNLTLSSLSNSYSGATTVQGGTLFVSGSITASSLTTINGTGTLGGAGTVGALAVASGGTVSPGASAIGAGTLNVGATSLQVGGTYKLELRNDGSTGAAGTQWDKLVTGALDMSTLSSDSQFTLKLQTLNTGGTANAALSTFDSSVNHTWASIITATSLVGFSSDKFSVDTNGFTNLFDGVFSVVANGNNLDLQYLAIPEPSAALSLLFGTGALLTFRRWRRMA